MRKKRLLAISAVVSVAILLTVLALATSKTAWIGSRKVTFQVDVLDQQTGEHIPGAVIAVWNDSGDKEALSDQSIPFDDPSTSSARQGDHDGVSLEHDILAGGDYSCVSETTTVVFRDARLAVRCEGYQNVILNLEHFSGRLIDPCKDPTVVIEITLGTDSVSIKQYVVGLR